MKVIEKWVNFNPRYPRFPILITLFEPLKCLVFIAKSRIDKSKAIGVNKSLLRDLLELVKDFQCFICSACRSREMPEQRQHPWIIIQLSGLVILGDGIRDVALHLIGNT